MEKMSVIYKVSYSALFIALGLILSRIVSLPFLFGLPFLKISLTNSVVMFSSLYLGPVCGLLVGGSIDILGALIMPQGGSFNPLFTIPALLTGLIPYYAYKLLNNKFDKKVPVSLAIVLFILSTIVSCIFIFNDSIYSESGKKSYEITLTMKILIPVLSYFLSFVYLLITKIIKDKFKDKRVSKYYNFNIVSSSVFITYFIFKIPVSSLIKSLILNYNFLFVFVCQLLVGFIACFVHSAIIFIALNVTTYFNTKGALIDIIEKKKEN